MLTHLCAVFSRLFHEWLCRQDYWERRWLGRARIRLKRYWDGLFSWVYPFWFVRTCIDDRHVLLFMLLFLCVHSVSLTFSWYSSRGITFPCKCESFCPSYSFSHEKECDFLWRQKLLFSTSFVFSFDDDVLFFSPISSPSHTYVAIKLDRPSSRHVILGWYSEIQFGSQSCSLLLSHY